MSSYDLASYTLTLRLRKFKTLLVEGPTDKQVLQRIFTEYEEQTGSVRKCVVDDVRLLDRENTFSRLGNKERVVKAGEHFANGRSTFKVLIDREWDGIDLDAIVEPLPAIAAPSHMHITCGHSVENYWFTAQALVSYLKFHHGSVCGVSFFKAVLERYPAMLKFAAAFSLAIAKAGVIKQSAGLIEHDHVEFKNGEYVPTANLAIAGNRRHMPIDLCSATLQELQRSDLAILSASSIQKICHGHLGEEAIRAASASLAGEFGYTDLIKVIERGFHDLKRTHDADWLAKQGASLHPPLEKIAEWGCS